MVKQSYLLALAIVLAVLSSCQTTTISSPASPTAPLPTATIPPPTLPSPSPTVAILSPTSPPPSPTAVPAVGFSSDLAAQIAADPRIPQFAAIEIAPLRINEPTMAFPQNQDTVLQLRVSGYPDPKTTRDIVPPLLEAGVAAADQHQLSLAGIEVVFYRRNTGSPMLVWAATPPWTREQIFSAPPTQK